ncbi:MAG: PKD domain-containing protein [candidate division Zixibacteria bacterium]|nr:PKD domain-containing protein [Candidatus Tariuqbacter arcticus]
MKKAYSLLFISTLLFIAVDCFSQEPSQEPSSMVIYGSEASTREGDNDFIQLVFIQIPETIGDTLYLRLFDADCGDANDSRYSGYNTETRFSLYGDTLSFTAPTCTNPLPGEDAIHAGALITQKTCAVDKFTDNRWYNLASFLPQQGEKVGDKYYLKLVVEGLKGDDANVFDVFISSNPKRNIAPEGVNMFNFSPTIRLPGKGVFAEMRFFAPSNALKITVHNFDLAGAKMGVETAFRSNLEVASSGQDSWSESVVILEESEQGRLCALTFEGGKELPNDATFYITDENENTIPIQLPIFTQKPNSRPNPEYDIKALSDARTYLFDATRSSDADGDALNFFWDFGDGGAAEGQSVTHRYPKTGKYEAVLIVSDMSGQVGNSSLLRFPVWVNLSPVADAGLSIIAAPGEILTFDASESSDPDGEIVRYSWDFGDGSRAEGKTVTHAYKRAEHYSVSLRVEDNSGSPQNFGTDELEVWINSPPAVELGDDIACSPNQTIMLSGQQSFDSDGDIVDFFWNMGDGTEKRGLEIEHSYEAPGQYRVTLKVEDDAGTINSSTSDWLIVTVNDPPAAKIVSDRDLVSVGDIINFDGAVSLDRDGEIIHYAWTFGDGAGAEGGKPSHAYDFSGVYTVNLTVQDNSGTNSEYSRTSKKIIVNYPPAAEAGMDQLVTSSVVNFDGSGSSDRDGALIAYLWDFGDGSKSDEMSPSHTYGNLGTYNVALTITDDSKTSTDKHTDGMTVIVNHLPIADAGLDQIGTPGQEITFDGSESMDMDGEIASFKWNFGDGAEALGEVVKHNYSKPGAYSVTLTVRDNTGHPNAFSIDETRVHINAPPTADAGADKLTAPGDKVVFNGSGSFDTDGKIISYRWDFSDGDNSFDKTIARRQFEKPGIYTAVLTVTDNSGADNCQAQDKIIIRVNHSPEAKAGSNIHTNKHTVSFDAAASADADGDHLTYAWDFGDGSPPMWGVKVSHTYTKGGVYPVILTIDDESGLKNSKNSTSITVQIDEPPIADAGENMTISAGDMVLFNGGGSIDPEGGVMKYHWNFGDGETADGVNPTKKYTKGGVYQVTLTVHDDSGLPGNFDIDQIAVQVAESPVAEAGPDQVVGVNEEVRFDGTGSTDLDGLVNSYSWDFGDGDTGGGPTPTHVFTEPGIYRVTLTITGDKIGDCSNRDSDFLSVTVHDAPTAKFSCVNLVPQGEAVEFDASESESRMAEIVKYEWDFNDGGFAEGEKVAHTFDKAGRYIVTLTVISDSETEYNKGTAKSMVVVNGSPTADAGENKSAGVNQSVLFDGSKSTDNDGAITSYSWDFGDGTSGEGMQIQHQYSSSGRYIVTLKVIDDTELPNNWAVDTIFVQVNEAPAAVIECAEWVAVGEEAIFSGAGSSDADGDIASYKWVFSDGRTAEGVEVSHRFQAAGIYQVTLTVDDGDSVNNSSAFTTVKVKVNHPPIAVGGPDRIVSPGETVEFDGSFSEDRDGEIIGYRWDFYDGASAEGAKVSHVFSEPGLNNVVLTVTDDSRVESGVAADTVLVRVNAAPVAVAGKDIEAFTGGAHDEVHFDGSKSYDPDGDPLSFHWDFGDGSSANGATVSHKFLKTGKYTVKLRVSDSTGTSCSENSDEITVTVQRRD